VKTRDARTKESTHFERQKKTHKREPNTKSARGTTPLAPRRPPPLLPRYPNFPPPVELSFRHKCFARSLGPPGCTSHPPVGAHAPLLLPPLRRLLDPRPLHGLLVLPLVAVLEQVSLVWRVPLMFSGSHHQQWSSSLFPVLFKYTPMMACPDSSW